MRGIGFYVGHVNYFAHAKALIYSISQNTNLLEKYEIFMAVGNHVSTDSVQFNEAFDPKMTHLVSVEIPVKLRHIPYLDKLIAAQSIESRCDEGLIWLDVESYFCNFKRLLPNEMTGEIYVNPVDKKNIGIAYGASLPFIWQEITSKLGVDLTDFDGVYTGISNEKIYPYFNIGMVWIEVSRGVFSLTVDTLFQMLEMDSVIDDIEKNPLSMIFIHQAVFTVAMLKLYGDLILPLPQKMNYPLHLFEEDANPPDLRQIQSIRYDDFFDKHPLPADLASWFNGQEKNVKSIWYYR
ncbi:hypothetical protein [Fusibacter bizertensis]